jgi:hypothetical protein
VTGPARRDHPFVRGDLEAQRIQSRYRRLILLGKARLPLDAALRLVGPDCAYHLYFRLEAPVPAARRPARRRRQARG